MFKSLGVIAMLFALVACGPANAAPVLTVQPVGGASIGVGGTANFELLLINPDAVIGAFSVDIAFDPTVLHLLPTASLGVSLGDPACSRLSAQPASPPAASFTSTRYRCWTSLRWKACKAAACCCPACCSPPSASRG